MTNRCSIPEMQRILESEIKNIVLVQLIQLTILYIMSIINMSIEYIIVLNTSHRRSFNINNLMYLIRYISSPQFFNIYILIIVQIIHHFQFTIIRLYTFHVHLHSQLTFSMQALSFQLFIGYTVSLYVLFYLLFTR